MIAWLACIAWGAESADWHVAQARQFIKRGWTLDADAEVRAGLAAFPGHLALNALCVELARARMDIARALDCAAAGVASRDGDLELRAELSRIEGWMQENFGFVALQGPDGTPRGRVAIRPVGLMLDPELKAAAAQVAQAAAAGTALPISVALPAGEYDIEGTTSCFTSLLISNIPGLFLYNSITSWIKIGLVEIFFAISFTSLRSSILSTVYLRLERSS